MEKCLDVRIKNIGAVKSTHYSNSIESFKTFVNVHTTHRLFQACTFTLHGRIFLYILYSVTSTSPLFFFSSLRFQLREVPVLVVNRKRLTTARKKSLARSHYSKIIPKVFYHTEVHLFFSWNKTIRLLFFKTIILCHCSRLF